MGSTPPVLALLVASEPPEQLAGLLFQMRPWCMAMAPEPSIEAAAWLATSPGVPGLRDAVRSRKPIALWVRDEAEVDAALALRPAALLTTDQDLADGAIVLPTEPHPAADRIAPMPPFVRSRLRRRVGLPANLVVDLRDQSIPSDVHGTALAACAACIVTGQLLADALAWGAPTATDAASASAVGAQHMQHAVVGSDADMAELAQGVARDPLLAARLSRAGRRLVERRSLRRQALELVERLALVSGGGLGWRPRMDAALRRLGGEPSRVQPDLERVLAPLGRPRRYVPVAARP